MNALNAGKQRAQPPCRPAGRLHHLHFNVFVCDPCLPVLLLLLLLSAHLSADEEDQALISEKTRDLLPQLMDERDWGGGGCRDERVGWRDNDSKKNANTLAWSVSSL